VTVLLLDFSDISISTNYKSYFILLVGILLWFIPNFLSPVKNIKRANLYLNILIVSLVLFSIFNIVLILRNPSNVKPYGWLFVSCCFIISYSIIKKTNKRKLKEV
jgi:hypothetical protein